MMKKVLLFIFTFLQITVVTGAATHGNHFPSLAPMLEKAMPSIVNVAVQGKISTGEMDPEHDPKKHVPTKPKKFDSIGSGVIIDDKRGYVVTNAHVINHATTITLTLYDGRRVLAKVIGADNETDIAVLQIKADNLKALPHGDSNQLKVGDFVVAIGNPFGLNSFGNNQSATFGIVSALRRNTLNIEGVENFIQTDAAINPGNSGGALVNTEGQLVGINTAIITPFGGNIGIGFAIPINMVKDVVKQLIQFGSVNRGLMGIYVQHLTPELVQAFGLPTGTKGALITQVNDNSPAAKAGLKSGDVITHINDTAITDSAQVKTTIGLLRIGTSVKMKVIRDKRVLTINAIVTSVKQHEMQIQAANPFLYGLALADFTQQTPLQGIITGVQIVGASEQSAGYRAGLRPGDVISQANGRLVQNIKELSDIARQAQNQLLLRVLRGSGALYIVINEK